MPRVGEFGVIGEPIIADFFQIPFLTSLQPHNITTHCDNTVVLMIPVIVPMVLRLRSLQLQIRSCQNIKLSLTLNSARQVTASRAEEDDGGKERGEADRDG